MAVAAKQFDEPTAFVLRWPTIMGYSALTAEQVDELGAYVEGVTAQHEPEDQIAVVLKDSKKKSHVAHPLIPRDAAKALQSAQRRAAITLLRQPLRREVVEDECEPPPPTVVVRHHILTEEEARLNHAPPPKSERIRWVDAESDPEDRQELMREAVKKVYGFVHWIKPFSELDYLVRAIRKAAREVGILD